MADGLYPYSRHYLSAVQKRFGAWFKNHFATIGLVGMHEGCINLLGQGIETVAGRTLALETLGFMRERLLSFQQQTQNLYNLEATPAESASFRLAQLDRQHFPHMPALAELGEAGYTNSTQLPVGLSDDPFFALEHQDALQPLYTGGTVLHFFLGERPADTAGLKHFIKKVASDFHLPSFTVTPTTSICPVHGYLPGEQATCWCGQATEVYSRVVGYLRPVAHWNPGKQAEFKKRKTFRLPP
jgi:ribonucleoside-triphosphate reductase